MDGVIYLMVGQNRHAEHLVVSVWNLLKHWNGPVALLAGVSQKLKGDDNSLLLCEAIAKDASPRKVDVIEFDYDVLKANHKSHTTYLAKTDMHRMSPFTRTIFLDVDTLPVGDIGDMFPTDNEVRITAWMDWTSLGHMVAGRIRKWRSVARAEVDRMLSEPYPAINTGVIGFSRNCETFMEAWREMTLRNVSWICDEIACQLIFPDYPSKVLDTRWNCSPVYENTWLQHGLSVAETEALDSLTASNNGKTWRVVNETDLCQMIQWSMAREAQTLDETHVVSPARIWHGHGQKFPRRPMGRAVWWPAYQEAVAANFAGIADWTPRMKCLRRYLKEPAKYEGHQDDE